MLQSIELTFPLSMLTSDPRTDPRGMEVGVRALMRNVLHTFYPASLPISVEFCGIPEIVCKVAIDNPQGYDAQVVEDAECAEVEAIMAHVDAALDRMEMGECECDEVCGESACKRTLPVLGFTWIEWVPPADRAGFQCWARHRFLSRTLGVCPDCAAKLLRTEGMYVREVPA